jgi:predicted O-methyltransferase YrrM
MHLLRRNYSHWTPQYIADRLRLSVWERKHANAPWLTSAAVEILSSLLKLDDRGLEFGAGRSTVWFARRVNKLISIESDENWYKKVQLLLEKAQLENVDLRLASADTYVCHAGHLPEESVDFILVDGEVRDRCSLVSLPKLKPNGIFILDNANWYLPNTSRSPNSRRRKEGAASPDWDRFGEAVKHWRHIWTSNGVTDTAIFLKPA